MAGSGRSGRAGSGCIGWSSRSRRSACCHFYMQSKLVVWEAMHGGRLPGVAAGLAGAASGLARPAGGVAGPGAADRGWRRHGLEYAWFALATNLPAERILAGQPRCRLRLRPAVWAGVAALAMPLLAAARRIVFAEGIPLLDPPLCLWVGTRRAASREHNQCEQQPFPPQPACLLRNRAAGSPGCAPAPARPDRATGSVCAGDGLEGLDIDPRGLEHTSAGISGISSL